MNEAYYTDWFEWGGGEQPKETTGRVVECKFLSGGPPLVYEANKLRWEHVDSNSDIVAYRVVKPEEKSMQPEKVVSEVADSKPYHWPTGIEAQVCADIASRQALGIAKYGTTVAQNPLELRAWLQHAYEETLDKAVYLRRAIAEIDKT